MEGFRAPASSGLSKTPDISSHLRIFYKLLSQRPVKLGTFACLHKVTPGKIFVERAHRNRRNRVGGASRRVRGWVGGRSRRASPDLDPTDTQRNCEYKRVDGMLYLPS